MRIILLVLLGLVWSLRLMSVKLAALSGVPIHITVQIAIIGVCIVMLIIGYVRKALPPFRFVTVRFYILSGLIGFLLPLTLETFVSARIPLFVLTVVISTMPLWTLLIVAVIKSEPTKSAQIWSTVIGFIAVLLIAYDTTTINFPSENWLTWISLAMLIPICFAINTVFVASKWPANVDPMQVAGGQALFLAIGILLASPFSGLLSISWPDALLNGPVYGIVAAEAAGLVLYFRLTRQEGANFVSLGNYVTILFGAVIGYLVFDESLSILTAIAAALLVVALQFTKRPKVPQSEFS